MKVVLALLFLTFVVGLVLIDGQDSTPPPSCANCTETRECCLRTGQSSYSCSVRPTAGGYCQPDQKPENGAYNVTCPCAEPLECQYAGTVQGVRWGRCQQPLQ